MGLVDNLQTESVSDLALREAITATGHTTVREAIEMMRNKNLGCIFIVDKNHKPLGIFTEAMLLQLIKNDLALIDERLEQHMATPCPWVKLTDPVSDVLEALEVKNIRFLCVVDERGRVAALTGQKGLMEFVAEHFPDQVAVQRLGGNPYPQEREGA